MYWRSRFLLSLLLGVAAVSIGFAAFQASAEKHAVREEIQRHALALAESQQRPAGRLVASGSTADRQAFVDQFENRDRLVGLALYDAGGQVLAVNAGATPLAAETSAAVVQTIHSGKVRSILFSEDGQQVYGLMLPLSDGANPLGALAVFGHVVYTGAPLWRHALTSAVQTVLIVGITLMIVRWSLSRPLRRLTDWLHDMRTGAIVPGGAVPQEPIFRPLTTEVERMATSLHAARAAASEEARLRDAAQSFWTAEMLRVSVQSRLNGSRLFAVSNREPYEHFRQSGAIAWKVPPSGLVTALEPVLRACDGTWIAQATGDADRESADSRGRLGVPPDQPQYTLRRVWLSPEEEEGFYFGFANEGLWPLCHIAHTRPVFRGNDWEHYRAVNQKFADALLEEMNGDRSPLVLVQDYHFALLPRMIKEKRPDARVAIFWHIPWPNPEAFGICPWQRELLDGMLGADLIGFHIQAHCNNFLETADRVLECRIDREHFAVKRQDHVATVHPFPISVAFTGEAGASPSAIRSDRDAVFRRLGIENGFLGLGVDRVDYTKGIPERFRGIERLFEQHPEYCRRLTFVQIGAPSRTNIKRYQELMAEVEKEAERINHRFRSGSWRPIVFLTRHHSHSEILPYYRAADFCLVTSLHDGMNLVAKEYIAARGDLQGALILSRFAGASHELPDALIVNPYDTEELAGAMHRALTMPAEEQCARMEQMRAVIREHNVYRWAGTLISQLAGIRLETAPECAAPARVLVESTAE